jgi:hypothetical protein
MCVMALTGEVEDQMERNECSKPSQRKAEDKDQIYNAVVQT